MCFTLSGSLQLYLYFYIGTQAVNVRPLMDHHEIFTQNSCGGWADYLHFKILIFNPQKIW